MPRRTYQGEDAAQKLLDLLNTAKHTPGKRRILVLLEMMEQFRIQPRGTSLNLLALRIIAGIEWYRRRVRLGAMLNPKGKDWSTYWTLEDGQPEGDALSALLKLHDDKLDDRVRQCLCGRWFFARTAKHRFCSRNCQMKANRATPEWKKRNREHQRALRKRLGL